MVKLGIIGAGNMGWGHIRNVVEGKCPEITIAAVADRREMCRNRVKELLPDVPMFEEGSDLIASGLCDAVLIATPHYQHPTLGIQAMEAGLHVMCEKPAGVYTSAVRKMIAVADSHPELTYAMMFNQRTNCVYRKLKELLSSGEMGEIKRVNWIITDWYRTQYYYDSGSWRATWDGEGGGVLLNQCPHQLDLLQWLCGMPVKLQAHLHWGKWHNIEVEDDVTCYMEFANGATGVFVTTTADAPGSNRLEITTTRGSLVCTYDGIVCNKLEMDEREWCRTATDGFAAPARTTFEVETDGLNEQHVGVLNAFAGHILRGEPLVADGREGINGLMLSNAMHLSAWLGQMVELPIDEALYEKLLNERRAQSGHKEAVEALLDTSGSYAGNQK